MTVISLADFLEKRLSENSSLTDLLVRAKSMTSKEDNPEEVLCVRSAEMRKFFESRLNALLLDRGIVQSNAFLCATYVARILSDIHASVPDSFYATDYFNRWVETGDDSELKNGADICFVLCSLFPERCERRAMRRCDYVDMGSGLYYRYYYEAQKEIAYHMSSLFEQMSDLTARCLGH